LSAIEVTPAPSTQPERALPGSMKLADDALYTAVALTPFPIWRIRARLRKQKTQGRAPFRDRGGFQSRKREAETCSTPATAP
jgi:hypothetical protein